MSNNAIIYTSPVIDTHHHIWRHKDVAWLHPPVTPKLFGDYFGLRRDFSIEEWMHDIKPQNVVKTVHVTANWGAAKSLDETRWLQSVQDKHGYPHAFTAQADLLADNVKPFLAELATFKSVKGVRHQLYWESNPLWQINERPDLCNDPKFRKGFALLEEYGLHFELQVFGSQAVYASELVKAFPNTKFILLHSGMLTDHKNPIIVQQWPAVA
jgi:predicted TIM-barrel fold metal-dependent hydrolase